MGQKPGLLGRDGGQKELRTRGRHDEQRDAAQPQQGCPEQPDAGNGPAGQDLPQGPPLTGGEMGNISSAISRKRAKSMARG